ncbi:MAG TPA: Uma2 family endonuclease [Pyrinomonadaceae bacterium]|jgi:Uma2 family endonuclease
MSTTTQLTTADELLKLPRGSFRYELVKGELITMSPAGSEHGAVIMNLAAPLAQHIKAHKLGVTFGAETGFKLASDPDTVLAPDISFVRRERVPAEGLPQSYWPGGPDLAVEVLSPGDRQAKVKAKVAAWLASGARAVWVVSPRLRNVTVYRSLTDVAVRTENDELDGGDVVPGFRCRVAEIFD